MYLKNVSDFDLKSRHTDYPPPEQCLAHKSRTIVQYPENIHTPPILPPFLGGGGVWIFSGTSQQTKDSAATIMSGTVLLQNQKSVCHLHMICFTEPRNSFT